MMSAMMWTDCNGNVTLHRNCFGEYVITFDANGYSIRLRLTDDEYNTVSALLEEHDEHGVEQFCRGLVG